MFQRYLKFYSTTRHTITALNLDMILQFDIQYKAETNPPKYRLIAVDIPDCEDIWIIHDETENVEHLKNELDNIMNFTGPGFYEVKNCNMGVEHI